MNGSHYMRTRSAMSKNCELVFMGTGTSGNVPSLGCLLQDPITCSVCHDAYSTPSSKNYRRNTCALIRINQTRIIIDCGKTFYQSVVNTATVHKLSKIDGVLLSHGHADAILGLDDLRGWTMNQKVQKSINVYLNQETFETVKYTFPYLVDRAKATGSGEVGALNFIIITDQDFFINNVKITPLPVHHGAICETGDICWNYGFRIADISYIGDVSYIPESTFTRLKGTDVLVVDGLKWEPHFSHFSFDQALRTCLRVLSPSGRGYITGICHRASHDELNEYLENDPQRKELGIQVEAAFDNLLVKSSISSD